MRVIEGTTVEMIASNQENAIDQEITSNQESVCEGTSTGIRAGFTMTKLSFIRFPQRVLDMPIGDNR